MAKTHSHLAREDKVEQIVATARTLFSEHGYEATSMGRIAKQARVAPNTLYWYFDDKDALLIAVMDAVIRDALNDYAQERETSLEKRILWLVERVEEVSHLVAILHARVEASNVVRAWHDNFHRMLEALIQAELRTRGLTTTDAALAARASSFVVEGLIAHHSEPDERRALVRWMVEVLPRLGAGAAAAGPG